MDLTSLVDPVVALAEDAGRAILEVYSTEFEVQSKDDESPLTQADLASHRCIMAGLSAPSDCPLFGRECNPDDPVGACMVSAEGTCRIWHQYGGRPELRDERRGAA